MSDWIDSLQVKTRSLEEAIHTRKDRTILIYGAGGFGTEMAYHLRRTGVPAAAFLDRRAAELSEAEGLPVFSAEEAPFDRDTCVVLFSIVMDREERRGAIAWLRGLGYTEIIEGQCLRCLLVQPDDSEAEDIREYYRCRAGRIREAEKLFRDDRSLGVYRSDVCAHATGDYSACTRWESPMAEQYFPPDIPLGKGYRRFLDCGGYVGDTTEQAVLRKGPMEACAVFEPDSGNYARMVRRLEGLGENPAVREIFVEHARKAAGEGE